LSHLLFCNLHGPSVFAGLLASLVCFSAAFGRQCRILKHGDVSFMVQFHQLVCSLTPIVSHMGVFYSPTIPCTSLCTFVSFHQGKWFIRLTRCSVIADIHLFPIEPPDVRPVVTEGVVTATLSRCRQDESCVVGCATSGKAQAHRVRSTAMSCIPYLGVECLSLLPNQPASIKGSRQLAVNSSVHAATKC
jgi:hypothetical protein